MSGNTEPLTLTSHWANHTNISLSTHPNIFKNKFGRVHCLKALSLVGQKVGGISKLSAGPVKERLLVEFVDIGVSPHVTG